MNENREGAIASRGEPKTNGVCEKIPVVIGVTGHRDFFEGDKPLLKEEVKKIIRAVKEQCKTRRQGGDDTPVIMLNALAQGGDMLCADAAFEENIPVYAVLPCKEEKYITSFDPGEAEKLPLYLKKCKRVFVCPDAERNRKWLAETGMDADSYEYRQVGIFIAKNSHVVIGLWDGTPPGAYGCGAAEVINFALEHTYLNADHLFSPGSINDTAVAWIKCRRIKHTPISEAEKKPEISTKWRTSNLVWYDPSAKPDEDKKPRKDAPDPKKRYIDSDEMPEFLKAVIEKTVNYNDEDGVPEVKKLWDADKPLDGYRESLRYHYAKADKCSYDKNQTKYNFLLKLLAILATLVALTFLMYDDASLYFMIFPCTALIIAIITARVAGSVGNYHANYIDFRALAEALRIEFYMSLCLNENPVETHACELYTWSQKTDLVWIDKALKALAVAAEISKTDVDRSRVIDLWIGNNPKPEGQLHYHKKKLFQNAKKAAGYRRLSHSFMMITVGLYFLLFAFEIGSYVCATANLPYFWNGNAFGELSWRSLGAIIIGTAAAASLLFSSYWGKLSLDRKVDDNTKMSAFYAAAFARWDEVKTRSDEEIAKFVKEIAREEITENGNWCSYVNENDLEINI